MLHIVMAIMHVVMVIMHIVTVIMHFVTVIVHIHQTRGLVTAHAADRLHLVPVKD